MRLFQDAAGTIPAYEAGQPIGKVARAAGTVDASQATALSRPTLARWPKGGRRNLISTNTLTASGWSIYNGEIGRAAASTPWANGFPAYEMSIKASGTSVRRFGLSSSTGLPAVNAGDQFTLSAYIYVENAALAAALSMYMLDTNRNVGGQITPGQWSRISMTATATVNGQTMNVQPIRINSSAHDGSTFLLAGVMLERGGEVTNFQHITDATNIVEAGVADIWHLWNDGGDSLLAPLPTGAHEVATVTPMGKVDYATVTGDGTGKNILFGERVADIFARPGALSDAERLRLEEYWQQRYGAGYLVPPGMNWAARSMWQDASGILDVSAVGQPIGLLSLSGLATYGQQLIADGDFSSSTGWDLGAVWTIESGSAVMASTADYVPLAQMVQGVLPGDHVELVVTFAEVTGSVVAVLRQGTSFSGSGVTVTAPGTYRFVMLVSAGGADRFTISRATAGVVSSCKVTAVSVRRVTSPLARQPTALSRPTLARWPKGGRRNLSDLTGGTAASGADISFASGIFTFSAPAGSLEARSSIGSRITATKGDVLTASIEIDAAYPFSALDFCLGRAFSNRARVPVSVATAGAAPVLGAVTSSPGFFEGAVASLTHIEGTWWRVKLTCTSTSEEPALNVATMLWRTGTLSADILVRLRKLQLEYGTEVTPYQLATTQNDITEAGVPDVWHLYNDGGDSLPAVLPAGAWEIAWVTHLGAIGYANVISDGTTDTNLLRAERMADVVLKRGRFTSYEKAQLETQWGKYKP